MRKSYRLIVFFFLLAKSSGSYAQISTTGLVAHWPFTGNAHDTSGNGLDGNLNNVTAISGKLGTANTAYLFNGLNSFISIPYKTQMNVANISLCAVIKPTALYTATCQGNYVLSRGRATTSGNYLITYFDNAYNDCSQADTDLYVYGPQAGPVQLATSSWQTNAKIHTGNWYCLVMTYNGTTTKAYVNGTLILTLTGWAPIGNSTDSMCIGRSLWEGASYPYNFTGLIDDIAIYNRVLSDSEVNNYCTNAPKFGAEIPDTPTVINHNRPTINDIKLYPNPNSGSFTMNGTVNSEQVKIEVYNILGGLIYSSFIIPVNNKFDATINLPPIASGIYVLKVSGNDFSQAIRFVKE